MQSHYVPRFAGEFKASPDAIINLCRERGEWRGSYGAIPTPGHSNRDRAITIKPVPDHPLGFVVHCHNGDSRDAWRYVCGILGLEPGRMPAPTQPPKPRAPSAAEIAETERKRKAVERIVAESREIYGTPADDYLQSRGLKPPFPRDVRFHPALDTRDHDGGRMVSPGMVALVRKAPGARVVGLHRTFLTRDGRKNPSARVVKAMLGEVRGGAVWPDEFGSILGIGEGIESSLSFTLLYRVPCVAALSASNLGNLRLPRALVEIIIAADNDTNLVGQKAAIAAVERLRRPWRSVTAICPEGHEDFNAAIAGGA